MDTIEPKENDIDVQEKHVREKENYYEPNSDSGKSSHIFNPPYSWLFTSLLTSFCIDADSQIDILRAAGIGIAEDDPTEPILTLRMWVLGILFCVVICGLNTLYTLRTPSLTITGSVVLLLAYPLGKLWEKIIPTWTVPLGTWSFDLNPGPFNTKVGFCPMVKLTMLTKP